MDFGPGLELKNGCTLHDDESYKVSGYAYVGMLDDASRLKREDRRGR